VPHAMVWFVLYSFPAKLGPITSVNMAQRLLFLVGMVAAAVAIVARGGKVSTSRPIQALLVLNVAAVLYYVACTLAFPESARMADLADVSRPFIYTSFLLLPALLPRWDGWARGIIIFTLVGGFAQIVMSALVYLEAFWPLVDVFKGRQSDDAVIFHFFRWSGTFGFPSDYSFFLLFVFMLAQQIVMSPEWKLVTRLGFYLVGAVAFCACILSVSRGGLAAFAVMFVVGLFANDSKGVEKLWRGLLVLSPALLGIVLLLWALGDRLPEIAAGFDYALALVLDGRLDSSAQHRLAEISLGVSRSLEAFPLGLGPDRAFVAVLLPIVETFYGLHLIKWGFVGLIFGTGLYLLMSYATLRTASFSCNHVERALLRAVGLLALSVPLVFGWTSAMGDRFKTLPLTFLLVGYALRDVNWSASAAKPAGISDV